MGHVHGILVKMGHLHGQIPGEHAPCSRAAAEDGPSSLGNLNIEAKGRSKVQVRSDPSHQTSSLRATSLWKNLSRAQLAPHRNVRQRPSSTRSRQLLGPVRELMSLSEGGPQYPLAPVARPHGNFACAPDLHKSRAFPAVGNLRLPSSNINVNASRTAASATHLVGG